MKSNLFDVYVYSQTFSPCRSCSQTVSPNYLVFKIKKVSVCIGCCLLCRNVSGRTDFTFVQHRIPLPGFTLTIWFELYFRIDIRGRMDSTFVHLRIPVQSCQHYLGDLVTFRIYSYCLRSIPLAAFSSCVINVFEVRGMHTVSSPLEIHFNIYYPCKIY